MNDVLLWLAAEKFNDKYCVRCSKTSHTCFASVRSRRDNNINIIFNDLKHDRSRLIDIEAGYFSCFKCKSFKDPKFRECWALSNLRALWSIENSSKGKKSVEEYEERKEKEIDKLLCNSSS